MKDIKTRLQEWHNALRESWEQPIIASVLVELEQRFPELLGSEVQVTEPSQELHPMQQILHGPDNIIRFRKNQIVSDLLDHSSSRGMSLNDIARGRYSKEDHMQLAQLIGYSVSGYGDLSYVSPESLGAADRVAEQLRKDRKSEG